MKAINGVKVYQIGDCDWVYAPSEKEAIEFMNNMIDEDTVKEMLEIEPPRELTQEGFDTGHMFCDDDGDIDRAIEKCNKISYKNALFKSMKDGSKIGHFMTTEY